MGDDYPAQGSHIARIVLPHKKYFVGHHTKVQQARRGLYQRDSLVQSSSIVVSKGVSDHNDKLSRRSMVVVGVWRSFGFVCKVCTRIRTGACLLAGGTPLPHPTLPLRNFSLL